jgi:hypothetical protein
MAMADRIEKRSSAAYAALSEAGRKVLEAVEREVARGGGVAVISFNDLLRRIDLSRGAAANGLKQVELLGFVSDDIGPRPAFIRTLKLVDKWRDIDADNAHRLRLKSRLPKDNPVVRSPVAPSVERRTPSLPVLHFADDP